jgi:hypothetical protein
MLSREEAFFNMREINEFKEIYFMKKNIFSDINSEY